MPSHMSGERPGEPSRSAVVVKFHMSERRHEVIPAVVVNVILAMTLTLPDTMCMTVWFVCWVRLTHFHAGLVTKMTIVIIITAEKSIRGPRENNIHTICHISQTHRESRGHLFQKTAHGHRMRNTFKLQVRLMGELTWPLVRHLLASGGLRERLCHSMPPTGCCKRPH